jgi:hypothetical protein
MMGIGRDQIATDGHHRARVRSPKRDRFDRPIIGSPDPGPGRAPRFQSRAPRWPGPGAAMARAGRRLTRWPGPGGQGGAITHSRARSLLWECRLKCSSAVAVLKCGRAVAVLKCGRGVGPQTTDAHHRVWWSDCRRSRRRPTVPIIGSDHQIRSDHRVWRSDCTRSRRRLQSRLSGLRDACRCDEATAAPRPCLGSAAASLSCPRALSLRFCSLRPAVASRVCRSEASADRSFCRPEDIVLPTSSVRSAAASLSCPRALPIRFCRPRSLRPQ